jgi:DNA (cytosine-5)-methyltransferase 1
MTLTATDYFCGMGGSSSGLVEAGFEVQVAANHWERAIETHSANHPGTEHLCADIQKIDVRYLPKTDLLWASPICTELSPAGGRRRRHDADQPSLWEEYGHVPSEAFERTRVTFWEVLRSAEVHGHLAVLVENVVEAADWHLLPTWLHGWETLGYNVQIVCVSAAHIGDETNPHAPQWRDRLYFGITRHGIPLPDFAPRPLAWCHRCGHDVYARQSWKPGVRRIAGQPVGKYGPQYLYVCPENNAHGVVEPYVAPAVTAIDWTDLGQRIGDRKRPLGAATMRRIEMGAETIGLPALVAAAGNTWDGASGAANGYVRAWPLGQSPTPAQVNTIQNGIAMSEPFVSMLRRNGKNHAVSGPVPTFSAGGYHHGLTVPPGAFISAHHGGYAEGDPSMNRPVTEPLRTVTAKSTRSLVIPYRKGAKPYPPTESALSTMATREAHAILTGDAEAISVEDCYFRMLKPREAANAQRFVPEYVIVGNQGEQQMQAGNAVAVNVAHWMGRQTAAVLA